jgi:hypothetical protein
VPDEHPLATPSAPRGAEALTLRQADQARTDFAAIESNLEFIMSQLAGVPSRKQLARYSLLVMVGTCLVQTLAFLFR